MSLKSITESLKHMAFEDAPESHEEATKAVPQSATKLVTTSRVPPNAFTPSVVSFPQNGGAVTALPTSDDSNGFYQLLLTNTDFDTTEVGALIKKFLDPLKSVPMDESTRFKAAVAQAAQHGNVTTQSILAAVDGLKAALQIEQQKFQASAEQQIANEVTARQQAITEKNQQIQQFQQEVAQLSNELITEQTNIQTTQQNFNLSLNRRSLEIDQLKTKFAALLG